MKLYQVYRNDLYIGCVEAVSRSEAGCKACDKYSIRISDKLVLAEVIFKEENNLEKDVDSQNQKH